MIKREKIIELFFYIVPFIVLGFHWICVFPANLSTDSFDQLYQIETNKYSDIHPAAHTLFCKLLMQLYNSPATVIFFQILFLSIVVGYAFSYVWKKGLSEKVLFPILILWVCLYPIRNVTCFFWKDVFFSIGLLLLTLELIIVIDNSNMNIKDIIFTTISLSAIVLFRHNGIFIYIFAIFILLYLVKKCGKKLLLPIVISLAVIVFIKTVIYSIFLVSPNNNGTKYAFPAKAIVSVVYFNGNYTDEELEKIEQLMPKQYIKQFYDLELGQGLLWRTVSLKDVPSFSRNFSRKRKINCRIIF